MDIDVIRARVQNGNYLVVPEKSAAQAASKALVEPYKPAISLNAIFDSQFRRA